MDTIIAPLTRDLSNLVALSARRFSPEGDRRPWRAVYAPLAMSANSERLDQFEEGNATGGHASELAAIRRPATSPSAPRMTARRFPPPWRAEPIPGRYVVRDANGQALAYLYSRDNPTEALQANADKGRGATDRGQHREAAGAAREGRPTAGLSLRLTAERELVSASTRGPASGLRRSALASCAGRPYLDF
jgi:hypothetical protein